jgi:hypothetical protein
MNQQIETLLQLVHTLGESEAITNMMHLLDAPHDADAADAALRSVTRLFANIQALKSEAKALLTP